jgi:hypothetical protein
VIQKKVTPAAVRAKEAPNGDSAKRAATESVVLEGIHVDNLQILRFVGSVADMPALAEGQ